MTAKIQRVYGDIGRSLSATDLGDKVIRANWRCPLARKSVAAQRIEGAECANDIQASRRVLALHQPDRVTHDSEGDEVVTRLSLPDHLDDRASRLVEGFDRGVDPAIIQGLRLAQDPFVTRLVNIEAEDLSTKLGLSRYTPVGPTSGFDCLGPACPVGTAKPATTPRISVITHLLV